MGWPWSKQKEPVVNIEQRRADRLQNLYPLGSTFMHCGIECTVTGYSCRGAFRGEGSALLLYDYSSKSDTVSWGSLTYDLAVAKYRIEQDKKAANE